LCLLPHHFQFHVTQSPCKPALKAPGFAVYAQFVTVVLGMKTNKCTVAFLHDLSNRACKNGHQCCYSA